MTHRQLTRVVSLRRAAVLAGLVAVVTASCVARLAAAPPPWSYGGATGPDHWGRFSPLCADGRNQSPLLMVDAVSAELAPLDIAYHGRTTEIAYEKHDVEVRVNGDNLLVVDGRRFRLLQFHFHTPSETRLAGAVETPIEAHFVHQAEDGALAVVAVLFQAGEASAGIAAIQQQMPPHRGSVPFNVPVASLGLLPTNLDYWRFSGSLTTPPCTEGVRWLVLRSQPSAAAEQARRFVALTGENARPVQPLWARRILAAAGR